MIAIVMMMLVALIAAGLACYEAYTVRPAACGRAPVGWRCRLGHGHNGSCPAYPAWWNAAAHVRLGYAVHHPDRSRLWVAVAGAVLVLVAFGLGVWQAS